MLVVESKDTKTIRQKRRVYILKEAYLGLCQVSIMELFAKIVNGLKPLFGVFLVRIFTYSDWIQRDTKYLPVFSSNAGKYGPASSRYFFSQKKPTPIIDSFVNGPMVSFEHIQLNIQNTQQLFLFTTLKCVCLPGEKSRTLTFLSTLFLYKKLFFWHLHLNCLASSGKLLLKLLSNCLI